MMSQNVPSMTRGALLQIFEDIPSACPLDVLYLTVECMLGAVLDVHAVEHYADYAGSVRCQFRSCSDMKYRQLF
jgi:hypothetical protein